MSAESPLNRPPFVLRLLGPPQIEGPDGSTLEGGAVQRHRIALLALLALAPRNLLSRDRLMGQLWPEASTDSARNLLNSAVHAVRRAISEDVLVSQAANLQFQPSTLRIDVSEFEHAIACDDWIRAIELYTGPFLDGLALPGAVDFEQWADQERDRLERLFREALERQAVAATSDHGPATAVTYWRRRLARSPLEGRIVVELMKALEASGDRASALRAATVHESMLREELGVPADPEVEAFASELRGSSVLRQSTGRAETSSLPGGGTDSTSHAAGQLELDHVRAARKRTRVGDEEQLPELETDVDSPARGRQKFAGTFAVVIAVAGVLITLRSDMVRRVFAQPEVGIPLHEGQAVRKTTILLPDSAPLSFDGAASLGIGRTGLAISPDGSRLVYVAERSGSTQLYLRDLDRLDVFPLPGTDNAYQPFFSPDGDWIGFFADRHLKKLNLKSLRTMTIGPVREPIGAAWALDDRILVADNQGFRLSWISSAGGTLEPIPAQLNFRVTNPQFVGGTDWIVHSAQDGVLSLTSLSDGRRFAFTSDRLVPREAVTVSKFIIGTNPFYLESGHLVYVSGDGVVMVLPFDLHGRAVLGPPTPVQDSIRLESAEGGAQFAVSRGGTFVYAGGGNMRHNQFVWVNHTTGRVDTLPFPKEVYGAFDLSPDGRRILARIQPAIGPAELWILDIDREARTRLVTGGAVTPFLRWWPDGRHVLYGEFGVSGGDADAVIVRQDVGSRDRDTLFHGRAHMVPAPDGASIAISDGPSWLLVPIEEHRRLPALRRTFAFAAFSPDGRWLAYTDIQSGVQSEVYVAPVEDFARRYKISSDGGEEAVWSPDGGSLVYRNGKQWLRVEVSFAGSLGAGRPQVLFSGPFAQVPGWSSDISADGNQQLVLMGPQERSATVLTVVTNWLADVAEASGGDSQPRAK